MTPHIILKKVWSDDDVVEFKVTTSDGSSQICVNVYAGHGTFESLIADLERFKGQVHGGIYDLELGKFGPEYAKGAFEARLHFHPPGRGYLCVTVNAESEWYPFSKMEVASRATLHLKSEPALLDRFINELRSIGSGRNEKATLECLWWNGTMENGYNVDY